MGVAYPVASERSSDDLYLSCFGTLVVMIVWECLYFMSKNGDDTYKQGYLSFQPSEHL